MQFAAAEVCGAAQVENRVHACDAEAYFGEAVAPWTAEGVGDQHGDGYAEAAANLVAKPARGRVGIFRQQDRAVVLEAVGFVDACGVAGPSGAGLDDQYAAIVADDSAGLTQHDFDRARVFLPSLGVSFGEFGGLEILEVHDATFRLRDYLLTYDENIAGRELEAGVCQSLDDQRGEIVARLHHRDALDRCETYRAHSRT